MTPTELAEAIAEFVAENRPDYVPHDPLTDAEVLERIVRLVDRGQYAHLQTAVGDLSHQLADMAAQVEMATQDIAELEKDRDEAIAQRQALISERQALRDMLEVIPHGVMPQ
jgi:chromosome segregation ATPase